MLVGTSDQRDERTLARGYAMVRPTRVEICLAIILVYLIVLILSMFALQAPFRGYRPATHTLIFRCNVGADAAAG
jgi:hypothetical protein